MTDLKHLYFLTKIEGLGSVRIKRLIEKFGSAENVFGASAREISAIENISEKTAELILLSYKNFKGFDDEFNRYFDKTKKLGIKIVTLSDEDYPELLKKIYDPPVMLYVRGVYSKDALKDSVGIVGTRKPTDYGKKMAEKFAEELSSAGIAVVSGFARGIDTMAHKAVLANPNAKGVTAAVFGCGVDVVYPPENKTLYAEMMEKGILISEYEVSAPPDAVNFPKRNRIVSGLSLGTIVVESDIDGGALITARTALDQSREVFAVPGYITSKYSSGTNALIKNSQAKLVENIDDVLVEIKSGIENIELDLFAGKHAVSKPPPELKGNEKLIYDLLSEQNDPVHIDSISEKTGLNISDSLVTLLNLEFKGCIEQLPGKRFRVN
jgi:DNA processing protein